MAQRLAVVLAKQTKADTKKTQVGELLEVSKISVEMVTNTRLIRYRFSARKTTKYRIVVCLRGL